MMAMAATPPTTPPTIAPVLEDLVVDDTLVAWTETAVVVNTVVIGMPLLVLFRGGVSVVKIIGTER